GEGPRTPGPRNAFALVFVREIPPDLFDTIVDRPISHEFLTHFVDQPKIRVVVRHIATARHRPVEIPHLESIEVLAIPDRSHAEHIFGLSEQLRTIFRVESPAFPAGAIRRHSNSRLPQAHHDLFPDPIARADKTDLVYFREFWHVLQNPRSAR